jgi:ERCC4-related helicase
MFEVGQIVNLKSDSNVEGAVIGITLNEAETSYEIYTKDFGIQKYYESQLQVKVTENDFLQINHNQFNAIITASLLRNPSASSLYSINAGRIDYIPHQFRPVLKFIRSDRQKILIADGVGVGKTIEAGLILKELEARRNLDSVLVICPKPLVVEKKWENEMKRFDEELTALDGKLLRYCIKENDYEGEWPEKYKKAIVPYSLFDETSVYGNSSGTTKKEGISTLDPPPKFDIVIVDEAHHIRNTSTFAYQAVSQLCQNAESVIFLTATPVQLEYDDLFVLLNLLRPDLIIDKETFYNMAEPNSYINQAAAIVRGQLDGWREKALDSILEACGTAWGSSVISNNPITKSVIKTLRQEEITRDEKVQMISDVESLHTFSNIISRTRRRDIGEFTFRKAVTVNVAFTIEQQALHDEVLGIMHDIFSQIHCTQNTKFMMTTIRRQTASCIFGLAPLLNDILFRHINELYDDDYLEDFNAEEIGSESILNRIKMILKMNENISDEDPKLDALLKIVRDKTKEEKNRIMVFSSFKHTLRYLHKNLIQKGIRVGLIHGEVPDDERNEIRRRFELEKEEKNALDLLLFSEVGCEGLDYQFCDCMVNYDLPWNPMRIEQRIGRIDRNGQTSESVSIFNIITPGTVDADIYERCMMRIGVFQSSIGDCEEILGGISKELMSIIENLNINDEERQIKIEQMTDNKIRLIKEQTSLEEKQHDLFGIKVPDSVLDEELRKAKNDWLSEEYIVNIINLYLKESLGDKEYILGDKELKTLRLSQEAKSRLLSDYRLSKLAKNEINRKWEKWLKSGDQYLHITFSNLCAKENRNVILITLGHPLAKQAALFFNNERKLFIPLMIRTNEISSGEYPFVVFQWKLSGEKEDLQIKVLTENEKLNETVLQLIQVSTDNAGVMNQPSEIWKRIEGLHYSLWKKELGNHREKTNEIITYRVESLKTSHKARLGTLMDQLGSATNNNIKIMKESQIKNAIRDYELHMDALEISKNKADIFFEIIAHGVLTVNSI